MITEKRISLDLIRALVAEAGIDFDRVTAINITPDQVTFCWIDPTYGQNWSKSIRWDRP